MMNFRTSSGLLKSERLALRILRPRLNRPREYIHFDSRFLDA